jgi:hypothetical protein
MSQMKWKKTKVQNLLKDENSGRYYGRLYANGKQVWKSLGTDVYSVALARLPAFVQETRALASASRTVENGRATVEQMANVYLVGVRNSVNIKATTVHYRE